MAEKDVTEHYIAEIKITKVRKGFRSGNHAGLGSSDVAFRETTTIARLVIPGSDLESLKHKASQHLALVDDEGDIEEGKAHRG